MRTFFHATELGDGVAVWANSVMFVEHKNNKEKDKKYDLSYDIN